MIFTGEGRIDGQSFRGKTISAICSLARRNNIRVFALCGKLALSSDAYKELGLELAVEIATAEMTEEESMQNAYELLVERSEMVMKSLQQEC